MINYQIVKPISLLTRIMSRLSNNDLSVEISGTKQKSEIGEMARAVEIFKINAIKKQQAENALQALNEQLEEKVYQRTKKLEEKEIRLAAMAKHAIEGEDRLKMLINTAMDAVIQIDKEGVVINWNKQAETIFGWSSSDVLGHKMHDFIIPEQYARTTY
jgi:PAS domain-containing protein